jgi:hypothetical protein
MPHGADSVLMVVYGRMTARFVDADPDIDVAGFSCS